MIKNIFLLWLQGWDKAPWLQKKVLDSWEVNNPKWNINLIDQDNIKNYVSDINYIFDNSKKITPQAKSDIIRLSLLKKYGGVWADSTLLCMQPLDHWSIEAIMPSGLWMYRGHGAGLNSNLGPASWFIISEKDGDLISRWKNACDNFWKKNCIVYNYFWMDELFKELIHKDEKFRSKWIKTPYLYCEKKGSAHTLASYNYTMYKNSKELKNLLNNYPPYVIKLSSNFKYIFPNLRSRKFKESNANYAISLSKRRFIYKHNFETPISMPSPIKTKSIIVSFLISIFKRVIVKYFSKFYFKCINFINIIF